MTAALIVGAILSREECFETFTHRAPKSARAYFHYFDALFSAVGSKRNLDPALLKAIAWCETRLDPCAQSPVGARGLMQFMGPRVGNSKHCFDDPTGEK